MAATSSSSATDRREALPSMAVLCAAVVAAPLAYLRGGMFSPGGAGEVETARPWWSVLLRTFLHYADSCSGVDGGVVRFLYRSSGSGGAGGGRPRRRQRRIFQVSTTASLLLFEKGVAQDGPGYVFLAPAVGFLADGGGVTLLRRFEAKAPMYVQRPTSGRAESAAAGACGFYMSWPSSALVVGGFFVGSGEGSGRDGPCK